MFTYQSQLVLYRQHSRQFLRGSKTFEFVCLIRVPEKKGTELLQKRIFQLTSTTLFMTSGNALRGPRSRLNNANDTNALSAVKTLVSDERTKVANDTIPTLVNI
jgi:hypothetical protein